MPRNVFRTLSLRGRIAIAGVAVAGLGVGVAPLAGAAPSVPTRAASVPVLKVAATYKGVPYRWGGTTTHGFDCSGYVQFVFAKLGVKLPRTAQQQYNATKHITAGQLQIGDLVFFGGARSVYHVGIYAGNNTFWNAPHTGDRVRLMKIWAGRKVYGRVKGLPSALTVSTTSVAPGVTVPVIIAAPTPSATPTDAASPATAPAPVTAAASPTAATAAPSPATTPASPGTTGTPGSPVSAGATPSTQPSVNPRH